MPRDISIWRKNVCAGLATAANEEFQRKNWFGKGTHISSPEEIYNALFSDYDIEDFVRSPDVGLTAAQKAIGSELIERLEAFDRQVGPDLHAQAVIDHVDWKKIREVAQKFRDMLGC